MTDADLTAADFSPVGNLPEGVEPGVETERGGPNSVYRTSARIDLMLLLSRQRASAERIPASPEKNDFNQRPPQVTAGPRGRLTISLPRAGGGCPGIPGSDQALFKSYTHISRGGNRALLKRPRE